VLNVQTGDLVNPIKSFAPSSIDPPAPKPAAPAKDPNAPPSADAAKPPVGEPKN
jgi:hypothetical protein